MIIFQSNYTYKTNRNWSYFSQIILIKLMKFHYHILKVASKVTSGLRLVILFTWSFLWKLPRRRIFHYAIDFKSGIESHKHFSTCNSVYMIALIKITYDFYIAFVSVIGPNVDKFYLFYKYTLIKVEWISIGFVSIIWPNVR